MESTPNELLIFRQDGDNNIFATLLLSNLFRDNKPVIFKVSIMSRQVSVRKSHRFILFVQVKTRSMDMYTVKPNIGVIAAGKSVEIRCK